MEFANSAIVSPPDVVMYYATECRYHPVFAAYRLAMSCENRNHNDAIVHDEERHPDNTLILTICGICDGSIER